MGFSVSVFEYTDQLVSQVTGGCDVAAVCRAASSDRAGYPLLAGVDDHDDTTFNARQAVMLVEELTRLGIDRPDLGRDAAQLIVLAELLPPAPGRPHHRRLVFSGD